MTLIEEPTPRAPSVRAEMAAADRRATWMAGLGWILTLAALLGLPGPDGWFMGLAPSVGTLAAGAALTGVFMQRFRGGFARLLLLAGAAALVVIGGVYLGSASAVRVVIGYFVPAALFVAAAFALQKARS